MRLYYEVALRSYRRWTAYRAATVSGIITNSFFGCVRALIFVALYHARGEIAGYDLTDAVTFVCSRPGHPDGALSVGLVGGGGFDQDGQRRQRPLPPVRLLRLLARAGHGACRLSPALPGRHVVRGDRAASSRCVCRPRSRSGSSSRSASCSPPSRRSPSASSSISAPSGSSMCAVSAARRRSRRRSSPASRCRSSTSPRWLRVVSDLLPFRGMMQTPADIFLGHLTGASAFTALAVQTVWCAALVLAGRAMVVAATRKVVVQGG